MNIYGTQAEVKELTSSPTASSLVPCGSAELGGSAELDASAELDVHARMKALQAQLESGRRAGTGKGARVISSAALADGNGSVYGSLFSSGIAELDALLPQGGFQRGSLVEWFGAGAGGSASVGAWWGALQACGTEGMLAVVDTPGYAAGGEIHFYPPAAGAVHWQGPSGKSLGVAAPVRAEQLLLLRPANHHDLIWCLDQVLRCSAIAAVWARVEQIHPRDFRRLQLSAEEGTAFACLVRPQAARKLPSWADLQIEVHAQDVSGHHVSGHHVSAHPAMNMPGDKLHGDKSPSDHVWERSRAWAGWHVQLHVVRGRGLARPGRVHLEWLMASDKSCQEA